MAYYQTDTASNHYFKSTSDTQGWKLTESPIYQELKTTTFEKIAGYNAHAYAEINPWKLCNLEFNDKDWKDGTGVNPKILLWTKSKDIGFSYNHTYESAYAKLKQGSGLGMVSQLAEGLRSAAVLTGDLNNGNPEKGLVSSGGRFMSQWEQAPSWVGVGTLKNSGSVEFTFRFGQAGLYSGYDEVYLPIKALATYWGAVQESGNYYTGPVPTSPTYFVNFIKNLNNQKGSVLSNAWNNFQGGDKDGLHPIQALTGIEEDLYNIINTTVSQTISGPNTRTLTLTMGKIKMSNMIVKDVSWNFNMEHTDEYGYPLEGSFTFGSFETQKLATREVIDSTFIGGVPQPYVAKK